MMTADEPSLYFRDMRNHPGIASRLPGGIWKYRPPDTIKSWPYGVCRPELGGRSARVEVFGFDREQLTGIYWDFTRFHRTWEDMFAIHPPSIYRISEIVGGVATGRPLYVLTVVMDYAKHVF